MVSMVSMHSPTVLPRHLGLACLLATLVFATGGCLIPSKPTECSDDSECHDEYGVGSYCADDGICEEPETREEILSPPCNFDVTGPAFQEGTRHIGVLLKLTDSDSNELIEPVKRAVDLAINDINSKGGVDGHEYAAIYCDNQGNNERAREAAQQLADIGIEAVVGPGFSSHTLEVAPEILIPNDIMMISPSATSPEITGIDDNNLVWRTVPSDVLQGEVLTQLVKNVRSQKESGELGGVEDGDKAKLGMTTREEDAYAQGLENAVITGFSNSFRDSDRFFTMSHPNPGLTEGSDIFGETAISIADRNPDVMMIWGIDEFWEVIRATYAYATDQEETLLESTIFVGADGAKRSTLAAELAEQTDTLGGRIWGTAPGKPDPEAYDPYNLFRFNWNDEIEAFGDATNHAFISYAYDAVYLFAFASAAAGTFEGPAMAGVMHRVTSDSGTQIAAKRSDFQPGVTELSKGNSIQFRGASGPIRFDDNGDPTTATIELWCFQDASTDEDASAQINSPGNLRSTESEFNEDLGCDFPDMSSN